MWVFITIWILSLVTLSLFFIYLIIKQTKEIIGYEKEYKYEYKTEVYELTEEDLE